MRHRTTLAATLAISALTLVSGCGDSGATGSPTTPPQTSTTSGSADVDAPAISKPLDTSRIDTKPCDVATPDQIESLPGNVSETKTEDTGAKSKSCAWFFDDERGDAIASIRAGINLETGADGLQSLYKADAKGNLGYFEELPPVEGYPAVAYERGPKNDGDCTMAVGVRNDRTYTISIGLWEDHPNHADPCTLGAQVAEFAIEYLQGRQ